VKPSPLGGGTTAWRWSCVDVERARALEGRMWTPSPFVELLGSEGDGGGDEGVRIYLGDVGSRPIDFLEPSHSRRRSTLDT
jgi:hypothetical protein